MRRAVLLIPVLLAAALAWATLGGARAEGGVPLPAEAGSEWRIVAGYNTGTHSDADGHDPYAIDLVREDAATAGSAVLSPTSGSVSYASRDCLMIRDSAAMEHLLCHIQPVDGLRRGSQVAVGERVGLVWQDGTGNNGGLAHIHYAVHESRGSGYTGATVPFAGAYAIEGVELLAGSGFNLHGDERFVSTNQPGWQAPARTRVVSGSDDGEAANDASNAGQSEEQGEGNAQSEAAAADGEEGAASGDGETAAGAEQAEEHEHDHGRGEQDAQGAQGAHGAHGAQDAHGATAVGGTAVETVVGGWRTIAIDRPTTVGAVWSKRGSTLESLFYWDRFGQRWQSYQPSLPGGAAAAWISLGPGDALLGAVQDDTAWLPRTARAQTPPMLELRAGWNLVSWHGADTPPADAFAGLESLRAAFLWDNAAQRYLSWAAEAPALINTLETVTSGRSLWIEMGQAEVWSQGG